MGISQLQDLTVTAVDANHYMVDFGDKAAGYVAGAMTGIFTTVTSGFLPGVSASVVRTPGTVTVPVSNSSSLTAAQNMAITAQNIQNAFSNTAKTVYISPIFFPSAGLLNSVYPPNGTGDLGPSGNYRQTSIQLALPSVTVAARSATEFDVTFTSDYGYQDQPLLSVLDSSGNALTGASVTILKESGDAFRVNDPETAVSPTNALNAQVAMDPAGDFVITWQGYTPNSTIAGSGYDIYARRFSPAGYAEQVQQIQSGSSSPLTFATGKGTTTISSFTSAADAASQLQQDLINLGYDADTTRVTVVNDSSYIFDITWGGADTDTLIPLVVCTTSGTTATRVSTAQVSFEADNNDDGTADTYVQSVIPQGNEFLVNTTTVNDQTMPSVAMDASGDFTIAWSGDREHPQGQPQSFFNNIEAQRFDSSGNRVGNEFQVNTTDNTTECFDAYVGMASDGTFAITWSNTSDPNYDYGGKYTSSVYAKVYGPTGNVLVDQFSPGGAGHSTVAFDSNDDFAISWQDLTSNDNIAGDGPTTDVFAQEYQLYDLTSTPKTTFDFKVIRPTFRLNSANTDPTQPDFWPFDQSGAQVAMDADGDLTASYTGFGPDVSNDNVVQEEINNILSSTSINYKVETLTFTFPGINASSGIPDSWFRLTCSGTSGLTTDDIHFDPTNLTTTAGYIQSALNAKLTGITAAVNFISVTSDGTSPVVVTFTVTFSATVSSATYGRSNPSTPSHQPTPRFGGLIGILGRWAPSLRLRPPARRPWGRR